MYFRRRPNPWVKAGPIIVLIIATAALGVLYGKKSAPVVSVAPPAASTGYVVDSAVSAVTVHDKNGPAFAFDYDKNWGTVSISRSDLTGHDGNPGEHGLPHVVSYSFTSEFELAYSFVVLVSDAKYVDRALDPKFVKGGNTYLAEDANYVYTYIQNVTCGTSCNKVQQKKAADGIKEVLKSFRIIR